MHDFIAHSHLIALNALSTSSVRSGGCVCTFVRTLFFRNFVHLPLLARYSSRKSAPHIRIMEQIYAPNISINSSVSFCEKHFHFSSSYTMIEENICENGCCCCSPINTTLLRVSFDEAPLSRGRGCWCFSFAPFGFFPCCSHITRLDYVTRLDNGKYHQFQQPHTLMNTAHKS